MDKPVLIYDGTCGFCKRWVLRFHSVSGAGFDFRPYQEAASDYPDIEENDFSTAAQLIEQDGVRHSGARAMLGALSQRDGPRWPLNAYLKIPGFKVVGDMVYHFIARNRSTVSAVDRFFWGKEATPEPPVISTAQWILGPLTGLSFFYYGASFIPRWDALYGWYYWAILGMLIGGPILAAAYAFKLRNIFRVTGRLLIILSSAAPINALAIFGFTRLILKWQQWAHLITPVALLALFFLSPLVMKIYRKLLK